MRRPLIRSGGLWVQLVVSSVLVVALTFAALAVLLAAFFARFLPAGRVDFLLPRADTIAHLLVRHAPAAVLRIGSLVRASGGHVWIVGGDGAVLHRFPKIPPAAPLSHWVVQAEESVVLSGHELARIAPAAAGTSAMAVVGVPVLSTTADLGARAVFWVSPVGGIAELRAVGARVALVAAIGLVVAGLLFAWLAERVARPVRRLEAAARRIAGGTFDVEPVQNGPAEVRSLAGSLREMGRHLGEVDQQRRDFLADVAHELRTPLTALRGALEAMRSSGVALPADRHFELALGETSRLTRLVDDLLAMARIGSGRTDLHLTTVDLWESLLRIALSLEPVAARRGVTVRFGAQAPDARVAADPDRLSQVLWNLMDNAVRHAPPGSEVAVSIVAPREAVTLTIANPGPPLSAEALQHLFDRFERGSADGEGSSGLGLAIARALAEAHGATLVADSPSGGGLRIRLHWPRGHAHQPPGIGGRPPIGADPSAGAGPE